MSAFACNQQLTFRPALICKIRQPPVSPNRVLGFHILLWADGHPPTTRDATALLNVAGLYTFRLQCRYFSVLTSRRIDRDNILIDIAIDHGKTVDKAWLCLEKLVDLGAIERDGLTGIQLNLRETRDRAGLSAGKRCRKSEANRGLALRRVMYVDRGVIVTVRNRFPAFAREFRAIHVFHSATKKLRGVLNAGG